MNTPYKFRVKDYVNHCLNTQDGLTSYRALHAALLMYETLNVDFEGIRHATKDFIEAMFMPLFKEIEPYELNKRLTMLNTRKGIMMLIQEVFNNSQSS